MEAQHIQIRVLDAAKALAFVGDLSMGQPTDHSLRTAWLATQLGADAGWDEAQLRMARHVSLLRWSGCTANAHGFAALIGDDVGGRAAMLAREPGSPVEQIVTRGLGSSIAEMAHIHCEVSGEVARMLTFDPATESALRHIFESQDATGWPNGVQGRNVPPAAFAVSLAGDLEILSRVYGVDGALARIASDAGTRYPAELVERVTRRGRQWHDALEHDEAPDFDDFLSSDKTLQPTSPLLVADVIDLKLPWMTGYSQRVAQTSALCCAQMGAGLMEQGRAYRAALIHGMGRASVSNSVWNTPGKLSASAWEKIRLVPYWTLRAGKNIAALKDEAEIASFAYERLDGSGYFRGANRAAMPLEARVLAAAVAWVALLSPRPWRAALDRDEAATLLFKEAEAGRFDPDAVRALTAAQDGAAPREPNRLRPAPLSARETEVLRHISQGSSNKEVARVLGISLSTVGTHMESIFRKLECSTRAAATLKASAMGML